MKHKIELKETRAHVTIKADSGREFSFSYRVDSVPFIHFMSVIQKANTTRDRVKSEEAQAVEFMKIFQALQRVFGKNYDELLDFFEEEEEELSMEDMVKLVSDLNAQEVDSELPKE